MQGNAAMDDNLLRTSENEKVIKVGQNIGASQEIRHCYVQAVARQHCGEKKDKFVLQSSASSSSAQNRREYKILLNY
jgi:hypothetical protein